MSLSVDPAVGMVAVEFLDSAEDEEKDDYPRANSSSPDGDGSNKAIFAMCLGVGKPYDSKVTLNYKRGNTLLVRQSERKYAIEIDGGACLISQYAVLGKVQA